MSDRQIHVIALAIAMLFGLTAGLLSWAYAQDQRVDRLEAAVLKWERKR